MSRIAEGEHINESVVVGENMNTPEEDRIARSAFLENQWLTWKLNCIPATRWGIARQTSVAQNEFNETMFSYRFGYIQ